MRITDASLPRAVEVLDALAARRGCLSLDANQSKVLTGRLVSLMVTGVHNFHAADPMPPRVLALHTAETARDLLALLGFGPQEIEPVIRQMLADFRDLERGTL